MDIIIAIVKMHLVLSFISFGIVYIATGFTNGFSLTEWAYDLTENQFGYIIFFCCFAPLVIILPSIHNLIIKIRN